MRVVRILGTLEPGGAQQSALQLSVALPRHGIATTLLAGDATPSGLELAAPLRPARGAYRVSEVLAPTPCSGRLCRSLLAGLAPGSPGPAWCTPILGAWWAAARALPPHVPLVASEHNQMSWPRGDHTPQARDAAQRVDMFFAHGPAARAWAALIGLDDGRLRDGRSSAVALRLVPGTGNDRAFQLSGPSA